MLHHQELNTTKKSKQMCFFFVLYSFMLERGKKFPFEMATL